MAWCRIISASLQTLLSLLILHLIACLRVIHMSIWSESGRKRNRIKMQLLDFLSQQETSMSQQQHDKEKNNNKMHQEIVNRLIPEEVSSYLSRFFLQKFISWSSFCPLTVVSLRSWWSSRFAMEIRANELKVTRKQRHLKVTRITTWHACNKM